MYYVFVASGLTESSDSIYISTGNFICIVAGYSLYFIMIIQLRMDLSLNDIKDFIV